MLDSPSRVSVIRKYQQKLKMFRLSVEDLLNTDCESNGNSPKSENPNVS